MARRKTRENKSNGCDAAPFLSRPSHHSIQSAATLLRRTVKVEQPELSRLHVANETERGAEARGASEKREARKTAERGLFLQLCAVLTDPCLSSGAR